MFSGLPLAADVAASLALSDRTETRVRQPGDTPPGASLDVASVPEARLSLAWPRVDCALTYSPRLTFWDVGSADAARTWLDAGSAHVDWHANDETTLSLHEDASYGAMSFAGLTLPPSGPEGAPPRVDVIPGSQILFLESSSSTISSRVALRRWELRSEIGYQVFGGADDAARSLLPLQRGPVADATLSYATSPIDHVATTLTGSETTFSPGPEIALVEGDEGWKHRWSALTETTSTLGIAEARVDGAGVPPSRQTDPVAELVLEHRIPVGGDPVALHVGARLGPVVNRLLGIVDERVQGVIQAKWTHRPFVVTAFGSAQQSVLAQEDPYATTLFLGELDASYQAADAVAFDAGVRGIWQRASQPITPGTAPGTTGVVEANIAQGILFVGITLRVPTIRL